MTLLEILVKELPGKGGWPKDSDDELTLGIELPKIHWHLFEEYKSAYMGNELVTRDQYEAALTESKNVAWNGKGLPPVGCVCEWEDNTGWTPVTIKYLSDWVVVFSGKCSSGEDVEIAKKLYIDDVKFRPLRSEEERKRDELTQSILDVLDDYDFEMVHVLSEKKSVAVDIAERIAAGEIPHVKIV